MVANAKDLNNINNVDNSVEAKMPEEQKEETKTLERNLLNERAHYKPFEYPQFFEYFKLQQQAHWLPTEVPMADDLVDFKTKLTPQESNLIIQVLRFFTQGDIEVQNNYNSQ